MNKYLVSAGLLVLASQSAYAAPLVVEGNPFPFERVRVADLNLQTQAGMSTIRARIRSAADRLCVTNNVEPVAMKLREKSCYRTAQSEAYRTVDSIAAAQAQGTASAALRVGPLR